MTYNNNDNNNDNAATQAQNQNNNKSNIFHALLRGVMMYFFLNMMKSKTTPTNNTAGTTSSTPHSSSSTTTTTTRSKMKPQGVGTNKHLNLGGKNGKVNPSCIWEFGSLLDLHIYITDSQQFTLQECFPINNNKRNYKNSNLLAEWHETDLTFGSSPMLPSPSSSSSSISMQEKVDKNELYMKQNIHNQRGANVTIPISKKVQFNQTHIYAHLCMIRTTTRTGNTIFYEADTMSSNNYYDFDTLSKNVVLQTIQLTTHKKRKRIRNEKNLLSSSSSSSWKTQINEKANLDDKNNNDKFISSSYKQNDFISPLTIASANTTQDCTLLYLKPALSLQLVDMKGLPTFPDRRSIPIQISTHMTWFNDTKDHNKSLSSSSSLYYPILYNNEFWILKSSYIELNDTISSSNIEISINDVSFWKWQLMSQMEESWKKQSEFNGGDDDNDSSTDMLRTMLLETNPILLGITFIVSMLHTIFDMLAFKNDIKFFKGKKSMEGLSLRSMIVNTAFQIIILLYLLDNDTSFMILVSNGVGLVIEIWKISKAVKLSIVDDDGKWSIQWEESETYSKSTTKEYDEIATDHLMFVTMPLVCGYGLYSLIHQKHKSWYSWILNTLVGFIYMFGFVMMTPQLFINYKLQSVAHLNWRTMTYKSINTFIDDLFAFVIKMPIMHRLACLRDDVIFLIFCYQKYKYKTDYTRVNEYGQCEQPTEEMLQESIVMENNSDQEVQETPVKRRGARDKKRD